MHIRSGDIVLVPFPFSDLKKSKLRPALILKSRKGNHEDYIMCAISSKSSHDIEIKINLPQLPVVSFIKVDKVATINKTLIYAKIARLDRVTYGKVIKTFISFLKNG